MAEDSFEILSKRFNAQLDGTAEETFARLFMDVSLSAAKRDGDFEDLFSMLMDFIRDERAKNIEELEDLFLWLEIDANCLEERHIQRLMSVTKTIFSMLDDSLQFQICHVWGKLATRQVVETIADIRPKDPTSRNLVAHSLGHIIKNAKDAETRQLAEEELAEFGGNPDNW